MMFQLADVSEPAFWGHLLRQGHYPGLPAPDIIHASPPCRHYTRLGQMSDPRPIADVDINLLIRRLRSVEEAFARRRQAIVEAVFNLEFLTHIVWHA